MGRAVHRSVAADFETVMLLARVQAAQACRPAVPAGAQTGFSAGTSVRKLNPGSNNVDKPPLLPLGYAYLVAGQINRAIVWLLNSL